MARLHATGIRVMRTQRGNMPNAAWGILGCCALGSEMDVLLIRNRGSDTKLAARLRTLSGGTNGRPSMEPQESCIDQFLCRHFNSLRLKQFTATEC